MGGALLNVGFDNAVAVERIVAVVAADPAPIKRLLKFQRVGQREEMVKGHLAFEVKALLEICEAGVVASEQWLIKHHGTRGLAVGMQRHGHIDPPPMHLVTNELRHTRFERHQFVWQSTPEIQVPVVGAP